MSRWGARRHDADCGARCGIGIRLGRYALSANPTDPGRVIYTATIEPRGGAQRDKEPFPATPLPAGEGYRKTLPGANGRWEVVTYQWSPGPSWCARERR